MSTINIAFFGFFKSTNFYVKSTVTNGQFVYKTNTGLVFSMRLTFMYILLCSALFLVILLLIS